MLKYPPGFPLSPKPCGPSSPPPSTHGNEAATFVLYGLLSFEKRTSRYIRKGERVGSPSSGIPRARNAPSSATQRAARGSFSSTSYSPLRGWNQSRELFSV